jgi:hypothetical protein
MTARPVEFDRASARVYLAARFARNAEVRAAADDLRSRGIAVVSSWFDNAPLLEQELAPSGRAAQAALSDLRELRLATTLVAFTEDPGQQNGGRGGRHTELGIAIGLGLRIILVGRREHVFHCLPGVERFDTWEAARESIVYEETAAAG